MFPDLLRGPVWEAARVARQVADPPPSLPPLTHTYTARWRSPAVAPVSVCEKACEQRAGVQGIK